MTNFEAYWLGTTRSGAMPGSSTYEAAEHAFSAGEAAALLAQGELLDALEATVRASMSLPLKMDKHRLSYVYRHDQASFDRDQKTLDLLVRFGRVTKTDAGYEWSNP